MTKDCLDQILKEADDCYSNSDYFAAAQQIEKAVDQQPDNAEFWATWGNIQFQAGEYPSAIEKYQEQNTVDLLFMVNNKRSFFENLLFRPVVNKIGFHIKVPLSWNKNKSFYVSHDDLK